MQQLHVIFQDGQEVDIDIIELGKDGGGAIIDHLAELHKGVKTIIESTTMLPPVPPKCEDDGCEMERGGRVIDTHKEYWHCPECGWPYDID